MAVTKIEQASNGTRLFFISIYNMKQILCCILACLALCSCGSTKLATNSVAYQSVRTTHAQPTSTTQIPNDAKIAVAYTISKDGALTAVVFNRTSEIMIIDQTMSFFVNSNGRSTSYYDPTVTKISETEVSSSTTGASVNLGAVAGALGIGGPIGLLASGVNVGGSETDGSSTTSTTYIADQPRVSLAPNGSGAMSKSFRINGIGTSSLGVGKVTSPNLLPEESYCRFSVCISYSLDNGATFDKIVTEFYANSKVIVPVTRAGKVNAALREVFTTKPDALNEYWWLLHFNTNIPTYYNNHSSCMKDGFLYDYK